MPVATARHAARALVLAVVTVTAARHVRAPQAGPARPGTSLRPVSVAGTSRNGLGPLPVPLALALAAWEPERLLKGPTGTR